MKLSIITINYNNQDGLQKTIDSIVSQSFKNYEWIVIDGGSNDSSREVLVRYCDLFTYWCSEPDRGIYNAINKGLSHILENMSNSSTVETGFTAKMSLKRHFLLLTEK